MKRNPANPNVPPTPTCWHRELSCVCLRLETEDGALHLFPYNQVVTASLVRHERHETLSLRVANQEVKIVGHNLRALFLSLQDFAVKWVRPTPSRYRDLADRDAGTVSDISIAEIE